MAESGNFLMTRILVYYFLLLPSDACFSTNDESVVCCDGKYCSCFVIWLIFLGNDCLVFELSEVLFLYVSVEEECL
jgi:hypothetical protein